MLDDSTPWQVIDNTRNATAARYSAEEKELQILYRDGTIYRFGDVPAKAIGQLIASPNPDVFIRRRLLAIYPHRRLAPAGPPLALAPPEEAAAADG